MTGRSVNADFYAGWVLRSIVSLLVAGLAGGSALAANDEWNYVVRRGDTLIGVAENYLVDPQAWPIVQKRNRIADPRRIPVGTRLHIPARLLRTEAVEASVLLVNGQVILASSSGTEKSLVAGDVLQAGDRVRVASGSNLSLRFPDGSRVLVLENSKFTLSRAVRVGQSSLHRILIDLHEGQMESNVVPSPDGTQQYEIKTPALRMSVRGTHFRASADSRSAQSRSEVLSGRVGVSGGRKVIMLGAGFGASAVPGKPPVAPSRLLAAPELTALPALHERVPLRFSWNPLPDSRGYRAQVLDSSDNLMLDGVFQDSAARWSDLPDGGYTLRVRGIGNDRLEGVDALHAFTLNARPEPPFSSAPTGKAYGESTQFSWTQTTGSDSYHFQLASDEAFTRLLTDEPVLTASRIVLPLAPGRYYWRVASIEGTDHGPFGDAVAFEQRPVPPSPQAEAPEISEDRLRFSWRAGEPGQHYLLQLSAKPDFSELLLEQSTDKSEITVPRPEAGDYFMRVKAIEADGFAGPFGATQKFTVPGTSVWWLLLLLLPAAL